MRQTTFLALSLVLVVSFSGCSLLNKNEAETPLFGSAENSSEKEIKFGEPVKMAVIWKDSTLTGAATRPTRGFGGRFYFFDKKGKSVRVDGDMKIYAYDDSDGKQQANADRRYEYSAADLQKHYSKTDIGHSYSLWIPWDENWRIPKKRFTLVPMFTAKSGQVVRGGQDVVVLPGKATETDQAKKLFKGIHSPNGQVNMTFDTKQVSFQGKSQNSSLLDTTTISLPRSMQQRLKSTTPSTTNAQAATPTDNLPPGITPQMIAELKSLVRFVNACDIWPAVQETCPNENPGNHTNQREHTARVSASHQFVTRQATGSQSFWSARVL